MNGTKEEDPIKVADDNTKKDDFIKVADVETKKDDPIKVADVETKTGQCYDRGMCAILKVPCRFVSDHPCCSVSRICRLDQGSIL